MYQYYNIIIIRHAKPARVLSGERSWLSLMKRSNIQSVSTANVARKVCIFWTRTMRLISRNFFETEALTKSTDTPPPPGGGGAPAPARGKKGKFGIVGREIRKTGDFGEQSEGLRETMSRPPRGRLNPLVGLV